jgi:hypothetical protein
MIKLLKINKDLFINLKDTLLNKYFLVLYKLSIVLILIILILNLVVINKKDLNYVIIIPEKLIVDKSCSDWINALKIISLEHFDKPLSINKLKNEFSFPASNAINNFLNNSDIFTQENIYQLNNPCKIYNLNHNLLNNINLIEKNYSILYSEIILNENNIYSFFKKLLISLFFLNIIFLFFYIYLNLYKFKNSFYISDLIKMIKIFIFSK